MSSPVTGRVLYIDGHSGADHGGGDSMCRTLGIQLARSDNSYEVLQLAHIERLKHYDASSQPDPSVGDAVTQGEHIGFVSAVSGGGCYGQSHHIHMELYSGSDTNRAAQPFTAKWAIAGCAFNEGSAHQGELVPCAHPSTTGPLAIRGKVTEFPLPTGGSGPDSITTGPDGALWFTESDGNRIGRSTTDGQIHEFPLPYNFAEHEAPFSTRAPGDIIVGPDGALWFTEGYAEQIGRITTDGQLHEFPLPSAQQGGGGRLLIGLTVGPEGALWFTERAAGRIGRITMSGQVREFSLPSGASAPDHITLGPDGALWFTESADTSNAIGRITPDGSVREFELPSGYAHPSGIAAGPDGAVWFTEVTGNRIGRITTTGEITEYSLPTANSYPGGITTGPDGALWFIESNSVARLG